MKLNKHQIMGLMRKYQLNKSAVNYCINSKTCKQIAKSIVFVRKIKDVNYYEK